MAMHEEREAATPVRKILDGWTVETIAGIGALAVHQWNVSKLMQKAGFYSALDHYQANPPMPDSFFLEYMRSITIETAAGAGLLVGTVWLVNRAKKYISERFIT